MNKFAILAAVGCLGFLVSGAQAASRPARVTTKIVYADPAPAASTPAPAKEEKAEEKKEEEKKCNPCARIPLFPPCKKKSECEEEKKEEKTSCKAKKHGKCGKHGKCEEVKCEEEKKEEKAPDPTNPCACDYKPGLLEKICGIECCGCEPACCKEPEPLFCKNWGKKKCDAGCASEVVVHEVKK